MPGRIEEDGRIVVPEKKMRINATGVTDVVREDVKDKRSEGRVR